MILRLLNDVVTDVMLCCLVDIVAGAGTVAGTIAVAGAAMVVDACGFSA